MACFFSAQRETCIKRTLCKQTRCIKWTVVKVPKYISLRYCRNKAFRPISWIQGSLGFWILRNRFRISSKGLSEVGFWIPVVSGIQIYLELYHSGVRIPKPSISDSRRKISLIPESRLPSPPPGVMGSCGPFIFIRFDHPTCQALEIKILPPRNFPILRCKTYLTKDLFICVNINNVEFLKRKETRNTYTCMNCVRPYITASLHFLVSLSFK